MEDLRDVFVQSLEFSPYGYVPSRAVGILYIVLFGVSTGQALYTRNWWLLPTVCICGAVEVAGWSGRLWSSSNPANYEAFLLQITTTILAPTFLLAANFVILGRIIEKLGTQYSRLPPRWYSIIFLFCDLIALIIQGTGGGLASAKVKTNPAPGGHVMLGGIAFQLLLIIVYTCFTAEFFVRYSHNKPFPARKGSSDSLQVNKPPMSIRLKTMSMALAFVTLCLFIRAIYRTIELSDGWTGRIIRTEVYFNVLDGAMIVLALFTINLVHPGICLADTNRKPQEDVPEKQYVDSE